MIDCTIKNNKSSIQRSECRMAAGRQTGETVPGGRMENRIKYIYGDRAVSRNGKERPQNCYQLE